MDGKSHHTKKSLTPQQNLLAAFGHRKTDWVPWIPYIGGVNTPVFIPPEIKKRQDPVEIGLFMQDYLGCDILIDGNPLKAGGKTGVSSRTTRRGDTVIAEVSIAGRILRTVHRTFSYGDQETSAISDYPVKTVEDLQTLELLVQENGSDAEPGGSDFEDKSKRLGERGLVYCVGPRTPLMSLVIEYMSLEVFIEMLMEMPERLEILMSRMHQNNLRYYRAAAKSSARIIATFDDFTTSLITPDMFKKYILPCLKEYSDILHQAGKYHMVHSCGHIRGFLPMCLDAGYDAHNYLAQPPVGDTPLSEAHRIWGDNISIMAAVDPVMLERGDSCQVERHVGDMLAELASSQSMMLMTSSKPAVKEENLRAVARGLAKSSITLKTQKARIN
ncbi:MAG: uroporphyrinogen decarboxylase family protein [Victivallales bacterium]